MTPHSLHPQLPSLLSFKGPDAVRYLNGQLTQDTRDLSEAALPSCVTDAKGKLQAFVHVFRGPGDELWIEAPAEMAGDLEARLTRYLIADDVEVQDLTGQWQLTHIVDATTRPIADGGIVRSSSRIDESGFDLWLPAGSPTGYPLLSPDEAETRRITARISAWGSELTAGMLPPEAGLDRHAISYRKGCYIGQEVLSRIKSAGRVNRRLAAFLVDAEASAGDRLLGSSERPAGTLTSVAPRPGDIGRFAALGYLDKSAYEATDLAIAGKPGRVEVLGFA